MAIKRNSLLCFVALLLVILSGCKLENYFPMRAEIDNLEFVRVIGIDKSYEKPDHVRLTLLYISEESSKEVGGGGKNKGQSEGNGNVHTVISEGRTVLEAINIAQTFSERQLFLGHMSVSIIGEDAAKEDLAKYIDFISRGLEARLSQRIYIAKGSTAEEFMVNSIQSYHSLPTVMQHLSGDNEITSTSGEIKLIELMNMLDTKYAGIFIPAIRIAEGKSAQAQGEENTVDIELDGYAIIYDNKLQYYTDKKLSTAINIANNKYINGVIVISDPYGSYVTLEIVELTCKKRYKFNGDDLESVTIQLQTTSNIGEQHSQKDIYDEESMKYLNSQQVKILTENMYRLIEFAQDKKIDILGIGKGIYHRHPNKWENFEDNWDNIFPRIKIYVDASGKIARTYDIRQPNALESR